ncbi:MAG: sodium:proton antiporter NhaD [Flavobacteriales bacterium]|nr:sodium:proton antiporter NhaD [Flavobacteriales bacterium]MDW8409334.1 sodium:proton antiporter NhaD [Flavobacteriales bacterium]
MFQIILAILFVIGYLLISMEARTHINKGAISLLMSVTLWTSLIFFRHVEPSGHMSAEEARVEFVIDQLMEHMGDVAGILFFLICAMTIVEVVDHYHGFRIVTDAIKTGKFFSFLWITSGITFFLSSVLDNLTTTIVMVSLVKNLVANRPQRWLVVSMIVVAANAGGAWSPIGDVTTTMLWIGGQVTPSNIILKLFIPSLLCLLLPLMVLTLGRAPHLKLFRHKVISRAQESGLTRRDQNIVFITGCLSLIFVPVFKSLTHLPPYLGIIMSMGILWVVTEILHKSRPGVAERYSFENGLRRIDLPSVFFFLGILLSIGALEAAGSLDLAAHFLEEHLGNKYFLAGIAGLISAIVDNVPMVAAFQHMFEYPVDDLFWEGLAYCAGTGGSLLIIGSAAGVAAMGMEPITFGWYLKNISPLALAGYLAGLLSYFAVNQIISP